MDEVSVNEVSVNKVSVNEVSVNEVSVNEVSVNEVSVNKVSVNEVSVNEEPINNDIKILMRQTTYTQEECKQKLELKSLEECIKEYLGYTTKVEEVKSTNQNIFKAIRDYF